MNIGILASHEGTTLQAVIDACSDGRIPGRVVVVVSNNSNSGALRRARQAGIPAVHLSSRTHEHPAALDAAMRDALLAAKVDLVFLAGYIKQLGPLVLAAFTGNILNTHPALLPKFGGRGMHGDRVFEAVMNAGETESGVSIHLVDSHYDTGPVVRQITVPILPDDSIDDLKARVRAREKELVVETLAAIAKRQSTLEIVPYDPGWPEAFEVEAARLREVLKALAVRIDHHGSTSVPGLGAKPVIDIQVSVASLQPLSAYGAQLEALGYTHVPHPDDSFCPFFHRPIQWPHTHHVHVVEHGGREERRTLAFRDYLREHVETAREYEGLKHAVAERIVAADPASQERYAAAKTEFIERVVALALSRGYPRDLLESKTPSV
jgi:phosphoribosylglycinamide formyltransferase-1